MIVAYQKGIEYTLTTKSCIISLIIYFLTVISVFAQKPVGYTWYEPLKSVTRFSGQGWENIGFGRLPNKSEKTVREPVWELSKHAAGLGVHFETDSDTLVIQYQVDGNLAMDHMPSTGVSGVDLYVKNNDEWLWARGQRSFNDTIRFMFSLDALPKVGKEYQLLFPLYNNIKNLRIGAVEGSSFHFLPPRKEKPIVVYGTSIAQGACASRPGMAWTNILSRKLDYPVVNLGFSGNGKLEPEVIALINEIDASIFVIDCLPNLSPNEKQSKEEVKKRIRESAVSLRKKHPRTSILVVQHAGYSDGNVDSGRKHIYETLNFWLAETFASLKKEGFQNLYMLTKDEIGLTNDAFVDGTHPSDLGMQQYAEAYMSVLRPLTLESEQN